MPTLPSDYLNLICVFAPCFSNLVWQHAQVLLVGAILTPGQRTVAAALRVVGLSTERQFQTYHRVLNRAAWSSWALSRALLGLLIQSFAAVGDVIVGLDDTIERRRGAKIKAKGIYRDPVRSSHSHFVKASGLRWLSMMLLVSVPWAERVWALPFLTVLAPSERYYAGRPRQHKKLTDWARQMIVQLRRWLPKRRLVVVADSSFAVISLLWRVTQLAQPICMIVRFRLDAALYEPARPRRPHQLGRPRLKGKRLPTLAQVAANPKTTWQRVTIPHWYGDGRRAIEIVSGTAVWRHSGQPVVPIRWVIIRDPKGKFKTQALLSTDLTVQPVQIIKWFVLRWQLEVTLHEVRTHLGVETQRQWSERAILRTTPALLSLFSLVTLLAHRHARRRKLSTRQAAWYHKPRPTFSDALALVRWQIWQHECFQQVRPPTDTPKLSSVTQNRLLSALCYTS
jgi:hypothetical protein